MRDPVGSIAPTAPASIAPAGLRPKTDTLPLSGTLRPSSMSSVVDLPAPLGPSNATVCPAGIDTSTSRTACTRPPGAGNDLARPLSSMLPDDMTPSRMHAAGDVFVIPCDDFHAVEEESHYDRGVSSSLRRSDAGPNLWIG